MSHDEALARTFAPALWITPDHGLSDPLAAPSYWAGIRPGDPDTSGADAIAAAIDALGDTAATDMLRAQPLAGVRAALLADTAPLPAPRDREGYFADRHLDYWMMGHGDHLVIADLARRAGAEIAAGSRFLDFGCSSGRLLRQFMFQTPGVELYGCDLNRNYIRWMRTHLAPARVFQNTLIPSLPLPDDCIDFAYAGSVFTHIGDQEEAWLMELRRVLRPGGLALLTVHTDRSYALLADAAHFLTRYFTSTAHRCDEFPDAAVDLAFLARPMPAERMTFVDVSRPIGNLNVYHSEAYLRRHWSSYFEIVSLPRKMHGFHQDAALLRKA